jgi:hypothetical protein
VFEVAMAQLTLVTVLGVADPDARAAVDEARAVFERLGAQPLLDRLDEAMRADAGAAPSRDADARLEDAPAAGGEVRISGTRTD